MKKKSKPKSLLLWMQVMFWVVLILFSIVKTKIIHYSSLCYFPITFISAYYLFNLQEKKAQISTFKIIIISFIGIIIASLLAFLPFFVIYKESFLPYIKDAFAQENIKANVNWTGYEALLGVILIMGIIFFIAFKKKVFWASLILFVSVTLTFQIALYWIAPKIEYHVQGAMINFLKEKSTEDCYIKAVGFKSYAQYYYSNRKPSFNKKFDSENTLLDSAVNKPVYFITKCTKLNYNQIPNLEKIKEEAGWVFYRRK